MNEEGYKRIIDELIKLVDEGVYVVDADGVGLYYNEEMAKNEKINVTDVVGKEFHKAFPGVKLSDSTMYHALKKNMATKNKQQTYTNLYGKEVTTINSTVPVTVDGKTIAAIEVARDITNIRSMLRRWAIKALLLLHQETTVQPLLHRRLCRDLNA